MTKADLIEEVSRVVEMTRKESEVIVEAIFDSIVRSLRTGDKIEIRGFGSFRTRQRQPRIGRNPKTGARVEVPAKKIPYFKPSKELKDVVNNSATAPPPRPANRLPRCNVRYGLSLESVALSVRDHGRAGARLHLLYAAGGTPRPGELYRLPRPPQFRHPEPLSLYLGPPDGGALRARAAARGGGGRHAAWK